MCGSEIDIVHLNVARSYCTREQDQIVSYMGTRPDHIVHGDKTRSYRTWALMEGEEKEKETRQSNVAA